MSPRVRTPKVRPTVWRERLSANVADRQTFWAMRGGHFLTVTVSRVRDSDRLSVVAQVTGNGIGLARHHEFGMAGESTETRIDEAKRWAEKTVDDCTKSD